MVVHLWPAAVGTMYRWKLLETIAGSNYVPITSLRSSHTCFPSILMNELPQSTSGRKQSNHCQVAHVASKRSKSLNLGDLNSTELANACAQRPELSRADYAGTEKGFIFSRQQSTMVSEVREGKRIKQVERSQQEPRIFRELLVPDAACGDKQVSVSRP